MKILSVDIGTTAMKMGIFEMQANKLYLAHSLTRDYPINIYNDGLFGDIEPDKWQKAFIEGCRVLEQHTAEVEVISLSGTTPGLTAMDGDGVALYPAILMLDQRSRTQARHIIDTIGEAELLKHTANIPVAGGCSLASILWLKDNLPNVYEKTDTFGHSNTVFCKWLTGHFAIDPSSASLTALYNTTENDLNWNRQIARNLRPRCRSPPTALSRLPEPRQNQTGTGPPHRPQTGAPGSYRRQRRSAGRLFGWYR